MATTLDPRLHPYRPDLAASSLKGRVEAENFTDGADYQVTVPMTALYRAPGGGGAGIDSELLFGETFTVYEIKDGFAWGQAVTDNYVGYVSETALSSNVSPATHTVRVPRTYVYAAPDIKSVSLHLLSLNATVTVTVTGREAGFAVLADTSYIWASHLAPLGEYQADYTATAETLLDTPYKWAGRTSLGLDCSALVQLALLRAGISCPRDSDMQQAALGRKLTLYPDLSGLKRGDLVFWRGHVGLMRDSETMIHASGTHMQVISEPLLQAAARIEASQGAVRGKITAIKRL